MSSYLWLGKWYRMAHQQFPEAAARYSFIALLHHFNVFILVIGLLSLLLFKKRTVSVKPVDPFFSSNHV